MDFYGFLFGSKTSSFLRGGLFSFWFLIGCDGGCVGLESSSESSELELELELDDELDDEDELELDELEADVAVFFELVK